MSHWPKDNEAALIAFYGYPGGAVQAQLVPVVPPFRMTYQGTAIAHIMFHHKAASALLAVLTEIWEHYGRDQSKIDALRLSHYDGAYNPRKIAGSNRWSNHAFGAAIDLDADHNGFNTGHGTMPQPVVDAFKRQGARWGGNYIGRTDPMHFEFCDNGLPDAVTAQPQPTDAPVVPPPPAPTLAGDPPASPPTMPPIDIVARAVEIAAASDIIRFIWPNRGTAPKGYIKGMAATFALVYAKWKAGDPAALLMAKQNTNDDHVDAISWYNSNFRALGMNNDVAGADVLRHLFTLQTGLGMRESSGRWCEGRDMSADNVTADTAEAGLFQMSWNAHAASPLIVSLFNTYKAAPDSAGLLSIFQEDVRQTPIANYGSGDGHDFQALCKSKPAFAVEAAAVGLRVIGGTQGQWGPLRRKEAEIVPAADAMFKAVQAMVDAASVVA